MIPDPPTSNPSKSQIPRDQNPHQDISPSFLAQSLAADAGSLLLGDPELGRRFTPHAPGLMAEALQVGVPRGSGNAGMHVCNECNTCNTAARATHATRATHARLHACTHAPTHACTHPTLVLPLQLGLASAAAACTSMATAVATGRHGGLSAEDGPPGQRWVQLRG